MRHKLKKILDLHFYQSQDKHLRPLSWVILFSGWKYLYPRGSMQKLRKINVWYCQKQAKEIFLDLINHYELSPSLTCFYLLLTALTLSSSLLILWTQYLPTHIFRMDQHFIVDFKGGDCYLTVIGFSFDIWALTRSFPLLLSIARFTHS